MSKRVKRLLGLTAAMMLAAVFSFLALFAFSDSVSFFYSPSEILNSHQDKNVRLGGKVQSILKHKDYTSFIISDDNNSIEVLYHGIAPSLMQDGIDIVVSGKLINDKFIANQVLVKHDERYYPKK